MKLNKECSVSSSAVVSIVLEARDGASSVLGQVGQQVGGLGQRVGGMGRTLQTAAGFALGGALTSAIGGVKNAMGGLFSEMVGGNAAFEQYEVQFGVLLGSTEAARERMADLAHFGATTPFELPGVVEADRILQAFGLHSEDAAEKFGFSGEQIRRLAGDVASGTGSQFSEMANLIGKFSAGATGEAIGRMQELGITTRAELTQMGLEFDKGGALLSPLPEAMSVVLSAMQDKYGGMMDAQSKTFEGMKSNLSDWKSETLRTIGAPIFDVLKENLGTLLTVLNSDAVRTGIEKFAQILAGGIGGAMGAVSSVIAGVLPHLGTLAGWLGERLPPIVQLVSEHIGAFKGALAGVASVLAGGAMAGVLAGVGAAITALASPIVLVVAGAALLGAAWSSNWGGIQEKTQAVWAVVQPLLVAARDWLSVNVPLALQAMQQAATVAWNEYILPVFTALGNFITGTLMPIVQSLWSDWTTVWWPAISRAIENAGEIISFTLGEVQRWIDENLAPIIKAFHEEWTETWWPAIQGALEEAWGVIEPIFGHVQKWFGETISPLIETARDVFNGAWQAMAGALAGVWDSTIGRIFDAIRGFWDWLSGVDFSFNFKIPDLPAWMIPGSPLPLHTAWKDFQEFLGQETFRPQFDYRQAERANELAAFVGAGGERGRNDVTAAPMLPGRGLTLNITVNDRPGADVLIAYLERLLNEELMI